MSDQRQREIRRQPTGNTLVVFNEGVTPPQATTLVNEATGRNVRAMQPEEAFIVEEHLGAGIAVHFERLGIAVLPGRTTTPAVAQAVSLETILADRSEILVARPEYYMFALADSGMRYANWVREGLHILAEAVPVAQGSRVKAMLAGGDGFQDTDKLTWGLAAVGCDGTTMTGKGIRIAVLDTGFDLAVAPDPARRHPDFLGRAITFQSFVPQETITDLKGHGTHCIGIAAGSLAGPDHARYGVAPEADIYAGKVLDNRGSGAESWILAGMEWAIANQCAVISMSLGMAVGIGEPPDLAYDRLGQRALDNGCLIVAAAGNDSNRSGGSIVPVRAPANSDTIMAVAAVDAALQVANFSNGGINPAGGQVDVAGPGAAIFSSFPMPEEYKRLSGTSMATPHVAGVAALWAQSDPTLRGMALWVALKRSSRGEIGIARDVGLGLVQAP